jgi:penicillin amidase
LSPHYRDLFPLWAAGQYVPMVYSREAVEQAAELDVKVEPGK